jgi:hypothetical protein
VTNSAGLMDGTHVAAGTTIEPGFNVAAVYTTERFKLQGSVAEAPGISAGLGGQTNNFVTGALLRYKPSRRSLLFTNVGYVKFSGSGLSGYSFSYVVGASYRLTHHISLTAEYYGYRALSNGVAGAGLAGTAGQTTVANAILFGVVFQLEPLRWEFD